MSDSGRDKPMETEPSLLRLTVRQWLAVLVLLVLILGMGKPYFCPRVPFDTEDYRLGSAEAEDYWLFEQYSRWAAEHYDYLVVGDSAIRGYYVSNDETLSHYLNAAASDRDGRYANLGVDGLHPVAMAGLLRYYGTAVRDTRVILHLNPLWMSSPQQDLQTQKEAQFHHERLTPQFIDPVPCYRASFNEKASAVLSRYVDPMSFSTHVKISRYGGLDLANWAMEHPYECPVLKVADANQTDNVPAEERRAWNVMGVTQRDMPFVETESSRQWRFFRETVGLLKERGNTMFVVVGPFNEHMLKGDSVAAYARMKEVFAAWLQAQGIPFHVMNTLDSDLYRDASHPLARGYEAMAEELLQDQAFTAFLRAPKH